MKRKVILIFLFICLVCILFTGCRFNLFSKNNPDNSDQEHIAKEIFAKEDKSKVDKYTPAELEQQEREKNQPKDDTIKQFILNRNIVEAEALGEDDNIDGADFITKDNMDTYLNYLSDSAKDNISFTEETWYRLKWKYSLEDRSVLSVLSSSARIQELETIFDKTLSKEEKIALDEIAPIVLKNNADKKVYVLNEKSLDLSLANLTVTLIDENYKKVLQDTLNQALANAKK